MVPSLPTGIPRTASADLRRGTIFELVVCSSATLTKENFTVIAVGPRRHRSAERILSTIGVSEAATFGISPIFCQMVADRSASMM